MQVSKRSLFLVLVFAPLCAKSQAPPVHPNPCDNVRSYGQTVERMQKDKPEPFNPGDPVILSVHWGDRPGVVTQKECYPNVSSNVEVSAAGRICASYVYLFHGFGGCALNGDLMPAESFNQLLPLLDHLPPDGHRVPANPLEVKFMRGGGMTTLIYDRDRLPDDLIRILHLTNARIQVKLPVFAPDRIWAPTEADASGWPPKPPEWQWFHKWGGTTAISANGTAVQHDFVTKTMRIYSPEGERIFTLPEPWQAGTGDGGYWVGGDFTPDGRYFLMQSDVALLYDTKSWQPITDPALFPQNLVKYQPSADWTQGIAITASKQVLVWDAVVHRILASLDGLPGDEVQSTAFSPTGAEVAVRSESKDSHQQKLSTWNVRTGQKIREFWPPPGRNPAQGKPIWWNDGRWLIEGAGSGDIAQLWDAATGSPWGSFEDHSPPEPTCWNFLVVQNKLLQRCAPGRVKEWTVEAVQQQLNNQAKPQ